VAGQVILGALVVPINAQALLLGPSATEGAPSPDCTIKGNLNRNGERIYHLAFVEPPHRKVERNNDAENIASSNNR
jgi:hypothetical protein